MMRILLSLSIILAVAVGDANAFCRRCRRSSCHGCNYVAPVAYQPQPNVQNFVFNNLFPPHLLAQGGNTAYGQPVGVQQFQTAYQENGAFFLDRAARFTDRAYDLAQLGHEQFSEAGQLQLQLNADTLRQQTNASLAFSAMEANRGTTQQNFSVQIVNGKMSIVGNSQQQGQQGPLQLATSRACAECHNGQGTGGAPKSIVLDGSVAVDFTTLTKCFSSIQAGRMPKGATLTQEQKEVVKASLAELIRGPAPILDAPVPPIPPEAANDGGGLK